MKTFKQFLLEHEEQPIIKNPTKKSVEHQWMSSGQGQLRYLKYGKNIWTTNAYYKTHGEMADHLGIGRDDWLRNTKSGYIDRENIHKIKNHPKGLHGYVDERHARHNASYIDDLHEPLHTWDEKDRT